VGNNSPVAAPKTGKCPHCGGPTGHLPTTYSHQTTDGRGNLVVVGRGYCSEKCATEAGAVWRKANVKPPVKTVSLASAKDEAHGGPVHRLGKP
jgi:hypothetical protein